MFLNYSRIINHSAILDTSRRIKIDVDFQKERKNSNSRTCTLQLIWFDFIKNQECKGCKETYVSLRRPSPSIVH